METLLCIILFSYKHTYTDTYMYMSYVISLKMTMTFPVVLSNEFNYTIISAVEMVLYSLVP